VRNKPTVRSRFYTLSGVLLTYLIYGCIMDAEVQLNRRCTLKYQIEYCPNPQCVQIHVDQRLINGSILSFEHFDIGESSKKDFKELAVNEQGLLDFCKAVSELDGMEEHISFQRYQIQMLKANDMFSWDEILPHVLNALQTFVATDSTIEESAPPKRPTPEELRRLERDMREFSHFTDLD